MSKLHCHTSRSLLSGSRRQTLTGGLALVPLKGSSRVMMGSPGRNIRVTEFGTGSVTELNCWKPESGGIRLAVLIWTKCCGLVYWPAPTRTTHFEPGRYAMPSLGCQNGATCFQNFCLASGLSTFGYSVGI